MTRSTLAGPESLRSQIVLHGAAHVLGSDRATTALDRMQAAVLAWVAVHGPTPRGQLAGLLWPHASEVRARGNLRQRLSKLRQSAGVLLVDEHGLLALAPHVTVATAALGAQWLDAYAYDDCDEFCAWLDAERESQRAARRLAMLTEVRDHAHRGALDDALRQADALLAADRESEEAYRALMEVFYLRGDRASAIAIWDRCKEMSRSLYGVVPSAETERLGRTILSVADSAPLAPAAVAIPVTVLRPPRLIGRAGVVDALVAAWRLGDASCVSGDAGVGKSRVLAEFAASLGPCLVIAARPGDGSVPFATLARWVHAGIERFGRELDGAAWTQVQRLLPQLAEPSAPAPPEALRTEHERTQAVGALSVLLRSFIDRGCRAFVFDDVQFADSASVESLQRLCELEGGGAAGLPARLVLVTRREETTPHAVSLLTSLASTRRLQRIELAPLSEPQVVLLMQSLELPNFAVQELAPRLYRQVGGNPAFLLESVKLMASLGRLGASDQPLPIPPGIEAVVERRLALLSPSARHVAELAAIAAERFSVEMAASALACPLAELGSPLRELEARQVLVGRQFVHDLVARAVQRSIPAAIAEFLHRWVAGHLAQAQAEPAVVAEHWRACGEWLSAARAYRAAADQARQAVRAAELARLLDAAAECFERGGAQAERFQVLCERLEVTAAPDYNATCAEQLRRLERIASTEEQQLQVAAATVAQHAVHARSDTIEMGERGMQRALSLELHRIAFEFVPALAWQHSNRGDFDAALAVLRVMQAWVDREGGPRRQARMLGARAGAHALAGHLSAAIADSEQSLARVHATGDLLEMLPLLANIGLFRAWRGEFDAAREVLLKARGIRDQLHGRGTSTLIDLHLGGVLRDLGDYAGALSLLDPALQEFRGQLAGNPEMHTDTVVAENHLAQLWLCLGDADRAQACLQTDEAPADARFRLRSAVLRLRMARLRGQATEAPAAAVARLADQVTSSFHRALAGLELARHRGAQASLPALTALCEDALMHERPGLHLHALACLAQAQWHTLDRAGALQSIERVVDLDRRCMPYDMEPLEVWSIAYTVLEDARRHAAAQAVRQKARDWLQAVVLTDLASDARSRFARRHAPALGTLGLTDA